MRRAVLWAVLMLLPAPAFAGGGAWSAQKQDDEGGPVMAASVVGDPDGNVTPSLVLTCADKGSLTLRYLTTADAVQPGSEADFLFENERTQQTLHMQYEDEDGAFAATVSRSGPLLDFLRTGDEVFISETSGNYPAQTFPLTGSGKAIDILLKTCK
jgi:hypothetical protein